MDTENIGHNVNLNKTLNRISTLFYANKTLYYHWCILVYMIQRRIFN